MRNPFARPETPPQWLLGSVCWTGSCVAGVVALDQVLWRLLPGFTHFTSWLLLPGCGGALWLLWRRAWPGGAAALAHPAYRHGFSGLVLLASVWRFVLLLFMGGCSVLWLLRVLAELCDADLMKPMS